MKKILAIILIVSTIAIIMGCAQSNESTTKEKGDIPEIEFVNGLLTMSPGEFVKPILDEFYEDNKSKFKVIEAGQGGEDGRTKIKAAFASGNPPDLLIWNSKAGIKEFVDAGALVNVDDFISNSEVITKDYYTDEGWTAYSIDGENSYGFPLAGNTTIFAANKSLFEKYDLSYPETYDDLLEVSEVFRENDITPIACGSKNGDPSHFMLDSIAHQFLPQEHFEGFVTGTTKFDTPEMIKAMTYVQEMADKGVFTDDPMGNGGWAAQTALYSAEKAAMLTIHPWTMSTIDPDILEKTEPIEFWKFPDATVDPTTFYIGGINNGLILSVNGYTDSSKTDAIHEITEFVIGDELLPAMLQGGFIPPRDISKFDLNDFLSPFHVTGLAFLEDKKSYFFTWGLMPNSACSAVYTDQVVDPLWAKNKTPEEAVQIMQEALDKAYE